LPRSDALFLAGAFAGFFGFAPRLALGALFLLVAPFFEAGFSGATFAPCSAAVAALSWSLRSSCESFPFLRGLHA
jgi:hypothetical protein